jgi:hypothetical protein
LKTLAGLFAFLNGNINLKLPRRLYSISASRRIYSIFLFGGRGGYLVF